MAVGSLLIGLVMLIQLQMPTQLAAQGNLEVYWESYFVLPNDLESCQAKADSAGRYARPKRQLGRWIEGLQLDHLRLDAVNVVNIAFASSDVDRCQRLSHCFELICGMNLFQGLDEGLLDQLRSSVHRLREGGIRVRLAFGGEQWGNSRVPYKTTFMADRVVDLVLESASLIGADGVLLVQKMGCGVHNLDCEDQSSMHLYLLERLRARAPPHFDISYAFPASAYGIDFPFRDVAQYGHRFLDTLQVFGSKSDQTHLQVVQLGVPEHKIVWGLAIGDHEPPTDNVTLAEAQTVAQLVQIRSWNGVALWSAHRDLPGPGDSLSFTQTVANTLRPRTSTLS